MMNAKQLVLGATVIIGVGAMGFAAGDHVFPGGKIEVDDHPDDVALVLGSGRRSGGANARRHRRNTHRAGSLDRRHPRGVRGSRRAAGG